MGLGSYPTDDYQFLGMLGMHGTYEANLAMHQSDLMICIGARFDTELLEKYQDFHRNQKKFILILMLLLLTKVLM